MENKTKWKIGAFLFTLFVIFLALTNNAFMATSVFSSIGLALIQSSPLLIGVTLNETIMNSWNKEANDENDNK